MSKAGILCYLVASARGLGVRAFLTKMTAAQKRKRARKRLRVLITVGSVVFILLLGFIIDSALYYNKVHAGVTVSGHSLSGLTRDEATAALRTLVNEAAEKPIALTSGGREWPLLPTEVDTKIDVVGAVRDAMAVTRKSNFLVDGFRRFILYFTDRDVPLSGTVDDGKLDAFLQGVARQVEVPPVEPGLVVNGATITPVEGRNGRVVDMPALRAELEALLLTLHSTTVDIPMVNKEPTLRADDTQQAVAQVRRMIAAPVTLVQGDRTWTLSAEQVGAYLDFTAEQKNGVAVLVPFLSATKMQPFFDDVADAVYRKPVNASFKGDGEQAWVVPAENGRKLDRQKTAEALTEAALKTSARSAKVVFTVIEPDRTTAEAEAMGITTKLASFTTKWEGTKDRQTNVRITTQYASNVLLAPGEIYDFDKQVGPRTEARGYKMAPGITAGELEDQLGGGICQVSTTLFNAALFAGLEIVERKNHSIYIDHYPKGRDATVSADGPNMRFRNDTDHYILVRGASDGITTTFVIYGTPTGRKVEIETGEFYDIKPMEKVEYAKSSLSPGKTEIKTAGQEGKSIKVVRTVKSKNGEVIRKDTFISIWKMIPQEIYVGKAPTTSTTAVPEATTTTKNATTTATSPATGPEGAE